MAFGRRRGGRPRPRSTAARGAGHARSPVAAGPPAGAGGRRARGAELLTLDPRPARPPRGDAMSCDRRTALPVCCPRSTGTRDAARRAIQRREALLALLSCAEQARALEEDVERLYDDQFIETCDDWVVPYIGDLVGYARPPRVAPSGSATARRGREHDRATAAARAPRRCSSSSPATSPAGRRSAVEFFQRLG